MNKEITVLRMDHREFRDQRITTHVALTSRAFGAKEFFYTGDKDQNLEDSVNDVVSRWGGDFNIAYVDKASRYIKNWKGVIIHLTMYGEPFERTIETLKAVENNEPILLIAGGPKVPKFVYERADFNTSIGWQPHSEVTAVGLLLYRIFGDRFLYKDYSNAKITINPDSSKSKRSDRFAHLS